MVAIDDATTENGALEFAPRQWKKGQVQLNENGIVVPEEESVMNFQTVSFNAGDVIFFSGYIPHRSLPNHSSKPRRAMIITFNKLAEGEISMIGTMKRNMLSTMVLMMLLIRLVSKGSFKAL